MTYPCICSFSVSSTCTSFPDAKEILIHITGAMTAGALITGTIVMNTPPFKLIVPTSDVQTTSYVFWRSHL